jgi:hypothetical protein
MTAHSGRAIWMRVISLIAIGFGLLTLREGGAVLFVDGAARQAAGHYVPFVLWFNFLAGFAYIVAGVGLWIRRRWAVWLAMVIAVATVLVFLAFGVHVALGGAWEQTHLGRHDAAHVGVGWHCGHGLAPSEANAPIAREH